MDNQQLWRIKSAMVLYELEKTLGQFVVSEVNDVSELSSKSLKAIKEREERKSRTFDDSTPAKIVAATYLDEVFKFAQDVTKNRPEAKQLSILRELFDLLDVFSIRNAISHPNRPFHPSYWYRIAAIATDPAVDKLQFRRVTRAFTDAEEERLASPPETWMNAPIWSLPNNLPEQFDHDITGLIARHREVDELNKLIQNKRINLIAIVAPGGTGKTALLLHALQEIILSPESTEWVDRILYFSSKTEVLTSEGIINQNPITSTIDGICTSITEVLRQDSDLDDLSFEEACEQFSSERIILCLDNLETILRDEPQRFDVFYRNLPPEWRVIVTSRVTVNSSTVMPLGTLSLSGAKSLAWNYLSKRGGERISEKEIDLLVKVCDRNPLGIRLTIDGFIIGNKPLSEMQSIAKQQVIDFSYRNLIEALPPSVHELLECLFVEPEPVSRTTACNLLQKNLDEISEAFNQVRGTSLVTRSLGQSEESYTLSSSIRDFLIKRPLNINIRNSIQSEARKRKQLVSEITKSQQNSLPLEREYITPSAPDPVKVISAHALKVWSKSSRGTKAKLFDELEKVRQAITLQDHSLLHRILGLILLKLEDRTTAKQELRIAFEMDPSDIAAGSVLASELRRDQDLEESYNIAKKLLDDGWGNPENSNLYHASLILQNYYLSLIWQGETDQVIQETEEWKSALDLRETLGSLRAMALRQSVESERDQKKRTQCLCLAISILDNIFEMNGYSRLQVSEGIKLIEQLAYSVRRNQELDENSTQQFISFVDKHLFTLASQHNNYKIDHPEVIRWVRDLSSIRKDGNPLLSEKWQRLIEKKSLLIVSEDLQEGWIQVVVKRKPNPKRYPFLFVQDQKGQQYFVHKDTLEFGESIWNQIQIGDHLEISPEPYSPEEGKYTRAEYSRFLE